MHNIQNNIFTQHAFKARQNRANFRFIFVGVCVKVYADRVVTE